LRAGDELREYGIRDTEYGSHKQFEVPRERTAARASLLSISTALVIFAAIVGFNFNAITSLGADDQDPVDDVAQALWDSAGN
jgi:hypothetical protein